MNGQIKGFDEIMSDMLDTFSDKYDKRQGSMLYNLCAPVAQEMMLIYGTLEFFENTSFVDTAEGEFLTRLAYQFGVDRLPAVASVREVYFGQHIPLGTRFSITDSEHNFRVLDDKGLGNYLVVAETAGQAANFIEGSLVNIDTLDDFEGAALGRVIIPGEDEESDDDLRRRVLDYVRTPTFNGNVAQYMKWASEFEGVGSAVVDSLWDGDNTVKVSITDANGNEASAELIDKFQNYLDPNPKGHGLGMAPIGAYVTVASVSGISVRIVARVTIEDDAVLSDIQTEAQAVLINYLKQDAFNEKIVRAFKVASLIDSITGIKTVEDITINDQTGNLKLEGNVLPKLEEVIIHVN